MEMTTDMLAPAAPAELNPLALLTIKPEEYVAQVFAPFRTKLESLKAEADTIHFKDDRMFDAPHRYVDIGTTEGMAIAVKYRAALRREVRLDAEAARAERKAPILLIGKLLDSTYKAIAEEVAPYEEKFDGAIKAEEKRKADIKAAKERAEAERIGAIQAAIEAIRALPARAAGKSAEELRALLERVAARVITKDEFDQFDGEAQVALDAAGQELVAMYEVALAAEHAAAAAEAARLAEIERMAAERAELARLRAEQDERDRVAREEAARVAAELAAESKRLRELAAAQEAELQKMRDAEAARARAAQAEQERVAAEAKRQMEAQQAAIAAERRALEEQKAEAARAEQARVEAEQLRIQIAADHDEALALNAQFDVDREARRIELQAQADQAAADARDRAADEHVAGLPSGALGVEALADMQITDGPSATEVLECAGIAIADKFEVSISEAVEMIAGLERADFEVALELARAA